MALFFPFLFDSLERGVVGSILSSCTALAATAAATELIRLEGEVEALGATLVLGLLDFHISEPSFLF